MKMLSRVFHSLVRTTFKNSGRFSTLSKNYEAIEFPSFPHFSYESPENLSNYTNVKLNFAKDVEIFLNGIENFIFDCDGVIVNAFSS
jgi:hypothetical protein